MSEVRINIKDSKHSLHGTVHSSEADAIIAALSAEPETIDELEAALERFMKRLDNRKPFAFLHVGEDLEMWDAGLVIVDLAARLVAVESTYSMPLTEGAVTYHNGSEATDIWLPYRLHTDWLIVESVPEYEGLAARRRKQRAANPPVDTRQILYGEPMIEFIVKECLAARDHPSPSPKEPDEHVDAEGPVADIHARWLMTPRADLSEPVSAGAFHPCSVEQTPGERSPRDVILEKLEFITFDVEWRALQWSRLGEGPPPLSRESFAYRFAGFGHHEYVIYYDLLRHLLKACWQQVHSLEQLEPAVEAARLERLKQDWLDEPQDEFDGRIPSALIESERRRVPITLTAMDMMVDDDCDLCRRTACQISEGFGPGFWYLDGCNMDDRFEFSTHRTREEWESEQRMWHEQDEDFKRSREAKDNDDLDDWDFLSGLDDSSDESSTLS